jgi:membrane protein
MPAEPRSDPPVALLLSLVGVAAFVIGKDVARRQDARRPQPGSSPEPSKEPLALQLSRAQEKGRGRQATSPERIPWRGWKDILYRTYLGTTEHRLLAVAAGSVFYGILAIFPGITALVSIYGLFAGSAQIRHHLDLLAAIVPTEAINIVGDQIDRISANGGGNLSLTFLLSLAFSLWSANAGTKAMFDALNVIYDETEKRGLVRLNALSLLFTCGLVVFLLTAIAAVVAAPLIFSRFDLGRAGFLSVTVLRWPLMFAIVTVGLSMLYRFGPSRRPAKWRWVNLGSVVGALAWLLGSAGFSWYLGHVADYNATYGSLGAAIGLMMWLWLSAIVVLLGSQLNAEVEHQTARDSTVGDKERPIGMRQAVMADTVGSAAG